MGMFKTNKQEEFSRAYVSALAAQLGFNHSKPEVDDESVDITFIGKYPNSLTLINPHLDVQLKCTQSEFSKDGTLHFSLSIKNYNDLRASRVAYPRYLFVVCIPPNEDDWIEMKPDEMVLRYSAYWFSLKNSSKTKNKTNITIHIPKINKLDKDSFKKLMDKGSEGISV
jgi:hypothetical protein